MYDWKLPLVLDSFFFFPRSFLFYRLFVEYTKTMFKHYSESSRPLIRGLHCVKDQCVLVWRLGIIKARHGHKEGMLKGERLLVRFPV